MRYRIWAWAVAVLCAAGLGMSVSTASAAPSVGGLQKPSIDTGARVIKVGVRGRGGRGARRGGVRRGGGGFRKSVVRRGSDFRVRRVAPRRSFRVRKHVRRFTPRRRAFRKFRKFRKHRRFRRFSRRLGVGVGSYYMYGAPYYAYSYPRNRCKRRFRRCMRYDSYRYCRRILRHCRYRRGGVTIRLSF